MKGKREKDVSGLSLEISRTTPSINNYYINDEEKRDFSRDVQKGLYKLSRIAALQLK